MSGDPKRRILYSEGDRVDCAYLVSGGSVHLASSFISEIEHSARDEILAGAIELFLVDGIAPPPRLTNLSVSVDARMSEVTFEQILKSAREYEYGIKVNRFFAELLEKTNDLVRAMFRAMPVEWRSYQELAILFYDLISRWEGIAVRSGVHEYQSVVDEMKTTALYLAGERFNHERVVSCIALGSSWLKSSQRFSSEQAFCRAGDDADCIYVLLQGAVHVTKPNQVLATIREQGECFGELAFFLRGKRTADLVATAGTALLKLDNATLPEFHSSHPDMFIQIAGTLAKRIYANFETLKRHNANSPDKAQAEARELNEASRKTVDAFLERLRRFLRIASNFEISELIAHVQERLGKV
jgi:CRP-like cAMP-binding protein